MAKTIEDYQNIIELLKRALQFYANKENYANQWHLNDVMVSYIEIDNGTQAEFALNTLQNLENLHEKMEVDFKSSVEKIASDNDVENMNKLMEDLKKLGYDKNI